MSKPKFTQGPWRVDTSGRYVGNFEHGSCLTAHTDIGGCSFDEQKANAHLIAAAPDMFDALEQAKSYIHALPVQNSKSFTSIMKVINGALEKARGES